jgi:hypothetical protein
MITRLLNNWGSYFSIAICLTLILWSYLEEGFYNNYISGEPFLVWTVYIFPWVIIAMNIIWQFKLWDRWFGR